MQIHRIAHPRAFTVVSNRTAQDNALSFNALGVLTYLLSRRDGDVVNCRTLAAIRPSGRDSVASALRELKQRGYYRVLRVNDPVSGQIRSVSHVYERPYTESVEALVEQPERPEPPQEAALSGPVGVVPKSKRRPRVPEVAMPGVPEAGNTGSTPTGVKTEEQDPTTLPGGRPPRSLRTVPLKPAVAAVLARISAAAPRLVLGARQRSALGPLVEEWLARGASEVQVVAAATQGLPEDLLSPVGLVGYRLRNCLPPVPPPRVAPVAERPECESCGRPLASTAPPPDGLCGQCRDQMRRAVEWFEMPALSAA